MKRHITGKNDNGNILKSENLLFSYQKAKSEHSTILLFYLPSSLIGLELDLGWLWFDRVHLFKNGCITWPGLHLFVGKEVEPIAADADEGGLPPVLSPLVLWIKPKMVKIAKTIFVIIFQDQLQEQKSLINWKELLGILRDPKR